MPSRPGCRSAIPEQHQFVIVKCNLCRRSITYLAIDFVLFCDPESRPKLDAAPPPLTGEVGWG